MFVSVVSFHSLDFKFLLEGKTHSWPVNCLLLLVALTTCQSRSGSRTGSACKLVCVQQLRAVTRNVFGEAAASLAYHTPHTRRQTEQGGGNQFAIRSDQGQVNALSSERALERPRVLQRGPYTITRSDSRSWHGNVCLQ